jgi:hypothetical protein
MTPDDLRTVCDALDDKRGMGGQTKLARSLGWQYSALWRKLNGLSKITHSDELAIRRAVALLEASGSEVGCQPTAFAR